MLSRFITGNLSTVPTSSQNHLEPLLCEVEKPKNPIDHKSSQVSVSRLTIHISSWGVHSERLFSASPITFRLYTVGTEVWGDRGATFLKTVFAKSLLAISPDPLTSSPDLD